jgi:hypothetical protein
MRVFRFTIFSLLFLGSITSLAQDSLARIVFFRQGRLIGTKSYQILHDNKVIGMIAPNTYFLYHCKPGSVTFKAVTVSEASFQMRVEAGKTYFLECGVGKGVMDGLATFRPVTNAEAQLKLSKFDKKASLLLSELQNVNDPKKDTIEAIRKMFLTKKRSGRLLAVLCGSVAFYSMTRISSTFDGKSSPPVIHAMAGVGSAATIAGFYKISRYSDRHLASLIDRYSQGEKLPAEIKQKLKPKYFVKNP